MYADDTVIYTSGKSFFTTKYNLIEDFAHVATWLEENQLIVNLRKGKSECMLFGTLQRTKNKTLDVVLQHRTLSETNSYKDKKTYKEVCSRLQLLQRLQPKLTTKATVTNYQWMRLPLVTYCAFVTYSSESYMKKAKSLHSSADQIIEKNAKQSLLKPIDSAMRKHLCKHVFKILIGEPFCSVFKDYFETMENNTHNDNCIIRLPAAKLEAYRKSFKYNGGKVFNSLPH